MVYLKPLCQAYGSLQYRMAGEIILYLQVLTNFSSVWSYFRDCFTHFSVHRFKKNYNRETLGKWRGKGCHRQLPIATVSQIYTAQ